MHIYKNIHSAFAQGKKLLAILIDPDKIPIDGTLGEGDIAFAKAYLKKIPAATTHLFIGGSTDPNQKTEAVVQLFKKTTHLPILLFPGDYKQVTPLADAILFLSLLSGTNAEFLIGQQTRAAMTVYRSKLEVIPTAYLLIDGASETAVQRISQTKPMSQDNTEKIVATALAGQYLGKKLIYLEAGSGALQRVSSQITKAVCERVTVPVIVGGGIRSLSEVQSAYASGATLVVVGTAFEDGSWEG